MRRIRSKDTGPEMAVRRMLHALGYRYVLHDRQLPGRPDLAFKARRKAIFINGCFWHGHDCPRGFKPKSNVEFWAEKLKRNRARDKANALELRRLGWKVLTVWECSVNSPRRAALRNRVVTFLES